MLALAAFVAHARRRRRSTGSASARTPRATCCGRRRGGVLVTQECIATPSFPVYLAAVVRLCADVAPADRRAAGDAAALHRAGRRAAAAGRAPAAMSSPLFCGARVLPAAPRRHRGLGSRRSGGTAARRDAARSAACRPGSSPARSAVPLRVRVIRAAAGGPIDGSAGRDRLLPCLPGWRCLLALWVAASTRPAGHGSLAGFAVLGASPGGRRVRAARRWPRMPASRCTCATSARGPSWSRC